METILHGSVGMLTARSGGHLVSLQCYVSPYDIFEEGTGPQLDLTDHSGKHIDHLEATEFTPITHHRFCEGFVNLNGPLNVFVWPLSDVSLNGYLGYFCSATLSGCQCLCDNRRNLCHLQAPNCSTDHWVPSSGQQGVRKVLY